MLLKRWDPLFDPEREQLGVGPIWVWMSDLPLQYWTPIIFKQIGNALGTYLDHDQSFESTGIMSMARILVHLDIRARLEEKITLHWRHFMYKQNLDYEGVPFWCRHYHKIEHLYRYCPLLTPSNPSATKGSMQRQSKELMVDVLPSDLDHQKEDAGNIVQTSSASQMPPPSPPKTRSRSVAEAAPSSGTDFPPCSSILHFNHFSISMDSSAPSPCLIIAPITCTIDPLLPIFSIPHQLYLVGRVSTAICTHSLGFSCLQSSPPKANHSRYVGPGYHNLPF